jgi:hypothetical protein
VVDPSVDGDVHRSRAVLAIVGDGRTVRRKVLAMSVPVKFLHAQKSRRVTRPPHNPAGGTHQQPLAEECGPAAPGNSPQVTLSGMLLTGGC